MMCGSLYSLFVSRPAPVLCFNCTLRFFSAATRLRLATSLGLSVFCQLTSQSVNQSTNQPTKSTLFRSVAHTQSCPRRQFYSLSVRPALTYKTLIVVMVGPIGCMPISCVAKRVHRWSANRFLHVSICGDELLFFM
ncbi:hypothetical protein CRM22_000724 [Opisthorchis felineus]|uniref:Uncharacterized protein n=1 Tax=Opisthorchis felineus TaxID=147828 RepID=A0A4S2MI79_OPIFE|nr:hypothetical protein CRM22_000724 [Opisthorchis felineus]